jgi:hypothetical protein
MPGPVTLLHADNVAVNGKREPVKDRQVTLSGGIVGR